MLRVEGAACVLGALLLLTLPLNWLLAAMLAAMIHEACHALAVRCCGGTVWALEIGVGGARMDTSPLERGQEALCALAGPAGSLALLALGCRFPRLAICGLCQGAFNLLPLFPLDGGRVLRCLTPKWCGAVERGFAIAMAVVAAVGALWWGTGGFPVVVAVLLGMKRKKPCKSRRFRVQ